mgnify:CR=1 FL=1
MRLIKPEYVFFSAELSNMSSIDRVQATQTLKDILIKEHIEFLEVNGRYGGINERSLVVGMHRLPRIRELARQFKQDSIMLLFNDERVSLEYTSDGHKEAIGIFKEVSKEEANQAHAYSEIVASKRFFIVN